MTRFPLDKNWIKCITVLEMKHGGHPVQEFLNSFPEDEMSDDVKACRDARNAWRRERFIPVRNFRSLAVAVDMLMHFGEFHREHDGLLMGKELRVRKLHDENSSQGISASILTAHDYHLEERILARDPDMDKLKPQIKNAILAKNVFRNLDWVKNSIYKEDQTIIKQFNYYIAKLCGKDVKLKITSAEDIPLAYMMDEIELVKAEEMFPSLRHHETDRITELETKKEELHSKSHRVLSTDHRIIMAMAMENKLSETNWKSIGYDYKVNKSFPKFWEMLDDVNRIYNDSW